MSNAKRVASMFLAVVMVFTVISVGFSFTASAAAPYVTRTPVLPPSPTELTVPAYITTYGTNYYARGNNVKPEGEVRFYLPNASNISLSTNSSGVNVSTYTIVGNTYVWTISGGALTNASATNIKFTVTYNFNGAEYSSSAWSAVKQIQNNGGYSVDGSAKHPLATHKTENKHITWIAPTYGDASGAIGSDNITSIGYIPAEYGYISSTDASASIANYSRSISGQWGDSNWEVGTVVTSNYYLDKSNYSSSSTLNDLPLTISVRDNGQDYDGNHPLDLNSVTVSTQQISSDNGSTYGATSGYATDRTTGGGISDNTNFNTKYTGAIPAAGTKLYLLTNVVVKGNISGAVTISLTVTTKNKLYITTYDKAALKSIITSEKAANRQEADFRTANPGSSELFRTWSQYIAAYQTAWELLGREDTTQSAINTAVSALQACIPVYSGDSWTKGMMYADANYATADYHIASRVPSQFTANTYSDGTKGKYYTYSSATALNNALEDIEYDRTLDKRYQAVVNRMAENITTAVAGLTYKSFNIEFSANGGSGAPTTAAYQLFSAIAAPTTSPTRTYYDFTGWYFDSECTQAVTWPLAMNPTYTYFNGNLDEKSDSVTTGITLYAGWQINATTLRFVTNGDTSIENVFANIGEPYTGPADPSRAGYNFVGWCTDVALTNLVDFSNYTVPNASSITFYGKWSIAQFTITFDSNSGTFASNSSSTLNVTQNYNSSVSEPEIPTKYGYGFVGWYYDNNTFANAVDFSSLTMPSQNMTVYAKWSDSVYTVTYESNGGTAVAYGTYTLGETVNEPTSPTRNGYTFAGWYRESGLQNVVSFPFVMSASSVIFYAKWTPLNFSIYFSLNDSSYDVTAAFPASFSAEDYYNLPCGSVLAEPEDPTMEGYVFAGWTLNGTPYTFTTVPAQSITLVATWVSEPDTVKYRLRTDADSSVLEQGDVVTFTASIQSNYYVGSQAFIVYYDSRYFEPAINGVSYTTPVNGVNACSADGSKFFKLIRNQGAALNTWECGTASGRVNVSGNAPIFQYYPAAWRDSNTVVNSAYSHLNYVYCQIAYSSTSVSSGATVIAKPELDICSFQLKVKNDAPVTTSGQYAQVLMPQMFTVSSDPTYGKIYATKRTTNDNTGSNVTSGITYNLINNDINFSVAQMRTSTITYETNTTDITIPNLTAKQGATVSLTIPNRPYFDFLGWSTVNNGSTFVNATNYTVPDYNVTLYAIWQAQSATYKVKHWKQDLTASSYESADEETKSATIGTTVTATQKTYTGFTCSNQASDVVVADGSLVLNLYYTRNNITITLNPSGGVLGGGVSSLSGLYGTSVAAPAVPTRTGYSFQGWLLNNAPYTFSTFPANNISLVASWKANQYTYRFFLNNALQSDLTITQDYGTAVTAPSVTVPEGQVFSGWHLSGSTTPYVFTTMPAANTDIYGELSINGYYVTLMVDGEQYGEPIGVTGGSSITAADVAYTPELGYKFSGWKLSNSVAGVAASFPLTPTNNMTLYGFVTRAKYDINFYVDGDLYDTAYNVSFNTSIDGYLPEMPEIEGYEFRAWYTDDTLTTLSTLTQMPAHDLDLYGSYVALKGTLAFDINGGTGTAPDSISEDIGTEVTTFPTDNNGTSFSKDGFVFTGWALTPDSTTPITSYLIESVDEITLYAVWAPAAVELISRSGGTAVIDNDNHYIYGLEAAVTETALRDTFLGVDGNGRINIVYSGNIGTGSTVQLISNYTNEVVDTYTIIIFGDVNGDGSVNTNDISIIRASILGTDAQLADGSVEKFAADVNGDGNLLAYDLSVISGSVVGSSSIDQATGRIG